MFFENLKREFPAEFKSYHKYVCIVQADGDNMGRVIAGLKEGELKTLSEKLLDFGSKAVQLIKAYGGLPIYAGGDDLLFIAPSVSMIKSEAEAAGKECHIFDLIDQLDRVYESAIQEKQTALSFGVAITYYKYPLYEGLELARTLLFNVAKNIEGKNAVAWKLRKNSGSSFSGELAKGEDPVYKSMKDLVARDSEAGLISIVAHKLRNLEGLLRLLVPLHTEEREKRLDALFDNVLDSGMTNKAQQTYLEQVQKLLFALYEKEYVSDWTDEEIKVVNVCLCLGGEDLSREKITIGEINSWLKEPDGDNLFMELEKSMGC